MPPEQDVNAGSSPASGNTEQSQQPASTPAQDASPAESSTASEGVKPTSVLEAVKAAMQEQRDPKTDAKPAEGEQSPNSESARTEGETPKGDTASETTEQGQGDKPKGKGAEARIRELVAKTKELEPAAKNWQQLDAWVKQSGITQERFTEGLEIMALIETNPFEAMKRLQPIYAELQRVTGEQLPEDLAKDVNEGTISTDHAKQLAAERSKRELAEKQLRARDERTQAERTEREQADLAAKAQSALDDWHGRWRESDPDYELKAPMVADRFFVLLRDRQGQLKTVDEGIALMAQARKDVEERLGKIAPTRRREITPVTGGAHVDTAPRPRSSLEAAKQALRK